jgi:hypothetical protein
MSLIQEGFQRFQTFSAIKIPSGLKNWQDQEHLEALSNEDRNVILSQQADIGIPKRDFSFYMHEAREERSNEERSNEDERRRTLAYRKHGSGKTW